MNKIKMISKLFICGSLAWAVTTLIDYAGRHLFHLWWSSPAPPNWRGAATDTLPGVVGSFVGIISVVYWKKWKNAKQMTNARQTERRTQEL